MMLGLERGFYWIRSVKWALNNLTRDVFFAPLRFSPSPPEMTIVPLAI
jgi:hypothetical protein